ncbi:hypothetical protein L3Q82_023540 [Scortum barcoo]|uniref:Uncharacterized protein n=1 Tax=Scortum barcoo TaxID=214431 RepID=A0ACB8WV78_9TELE|nr:hypothetical protein L3Q82_023540 [Scortum barcoo]
MLACGTPDAQLTGTGRPSKPQPGRSWRQKLGSGRSSVRPWRRTIGYGLEEILANRTGDIVGRWKKYFEDLLNPTDLPSNEEAEAGVSEVDSSITQAEVTEVVRKLRSGGKAQGDHTSQPPREGLRQGTGEENSADSRPSRIQEEQCNAVFVLVVEHWTSSIPSTGCLRVYGSLPNQSTCALWIWRRHSTVSLVVFCGEGAPCEYGVREPLLRAVRSLYDRSRSLVRIADWQRSQGPEGVQVWEPQDFISAFCGDDVVLMASSGQDLQHVLERFAAECEAAGMRISTSKSEANGSRPEKGKGWHALSRRSSRFTGPVNLRSHLTYGHELWVMTERTRSCGYKRGRNEFPPQGGWAQTPLEIGEVFQACPTGRRPQGRPRTRWRNYVSRLAWERLGVPPEELEEVSGVREVWSGHLCSDCCLRDPVPD